MCLRSTEPPLLPNPCYKLPFCLSWLFRSLFVVSFCVGLVALLDFFSLALCVEKKYKCATKWVGYYQPSGLINFLFRSCSPLNNSYSICFLMCVLIGIKSSWFWDLTTIARIFCQSFAWSFPMFTSTL